MKPSHQIEMFVGIVIMSTSGVLAKLISMPAPLVIWLRCFLAVIPFLVFVRIMKSDLSIEKSKQLPLLLSGLLMGAHWVTYFFALEYSNVAIGMLSLFIYPVMTVFLEPIFLKTKLETRHIPIALVAFLGIYVLMPEFKLSNNFTVGILFGLSSALFYSLRNILSKVHTASVPGETLMFYQVLILAFCMIPTVFMYDFDIVVAIKESLLPLLVLTLLTTIAGHSLFIRSLKNFSVSTVSLVSNLSPVIGIFLAWMFINEIPTGNVLLGGGLIMTTLLVEGFYANFRSY